MVYKRVRGIGPQGGDLIPYKYLLSTPPPGQSLTQGHYHPIYQEARKGCVWLVFEISNMLGEMGKQVVSARANEANKRID